MINRLRLCPDRHIIPDYDTLGTVGENNATVLRFSFFDDIDGIPVSGLRKELVAVNDNGSFKYEFEGDFRLPVELTSCDSLLIQVKLYDGDSLVWKSMHHNFDFTESLDDSGENIIEKVISDTKEECCSELAESLEVATGEEHGDKTWDELSDTVAKLPVVNEEMQTNLDGMELIREYFRNYAGSSHHLFTGAPVDENKVSLGYKLPYIYTPRLPWNKDQTVLSEHLVEAGVDVSSAINIGGGGTARSFSPLPKLQRLTLTGNANLPGLYNFMTANYELRFVKLETPSEDVLNANPEYYKRAFYRTERLEEIDCELDFTAQTSLYQTFVNCFKLRKLRIKPFTLSTSLDLGACRYLRRDDSGEITSWDSIISVLNAITTDKEIAQTMTITFNVGVETGDEFTTDIGMNTFNVPVYYHSSTGLYDFSDEQLEGDELIVLGETLMSAFMNKGVTLAWA